MQLDETSVQVIEVVPPEVQTALMNPDNAEDAVPLNDFIDETMMVFEHEPDARENLTETVKFLRFAEQRGEYDEVTEIVNGDHSRGRASFGAR